MTTARSFLNNGELTDYTQTINSIPNMWGLIGNMGIFRDEGVAQNTITVESRDQTIALLADSPRGLRDQTVGKDDNYVTRAFAIPHFPVMDRIEPRDIQGKRAYGTPDQADTLSLARIRKLEQMRKSIQITKEFMRMQAIKGNVVTPKGTVISDLYSDFGVSQTSVDFLLGTASTKINDKIEEVIAHIQDNLFTGSVPDMITVLCSPEFFTKLVGHSKVETYYNTYLNTNQSNGEQVLRDRLGTGLYRTFSHKGLVFVEYRGKFNYQGSTVNLVGANDAYAFPMGVDDLFVGYNGPADHLDFVNTLGEPMYAFEHTDPRGFYHEMFAETNYLPMCRRPQAVVKCTTSN